VRHSTHDKHSQIDQHGSSHVPVSDESIISGSIQQDRRRYMVTSSQDRTLTLAEVQLPPLFSSALTRHRELRKGLQA
jgi:hypothetical protein